MKKSSTFGGDAVKLTVSKTLILIIYMAAGMLLSRYRTLEEYGTYSQLQLVINLFSSFLMLGLPNSINYFLSRANSIEEENSFLSNYYTMSSVLSFILGTLLTLFIGYIALYFKNLAICDFSYFLLLYPWANNTFHSIDNVMVVYKKINVLMVFKMSYGLLLIAIIVLNHFLGYDFSSYMISFLILNIIGGIVAICLVNDKHHALSPVMDIKVIKEILYFSIPLGVSTLVGTLNIEVDKLLIGFLTDTEQLAIYSNAGKELPITIIAGSVSAVLIPQIIKLVKEEKTPEAIYRWSIAIEISFIIICFMVSGVFVYAQEVMSILYSDKYLPGVPVFRIYSIVLLCRVTYFGMFLNAYGKSKNILYSSIISMVINTILNPILYLIFGITGPAIATLISVAVMQMSQLIMSTKVTGCKLGSIFPWKKIGEILLWNIVFCIFFGLAKTWLHFEKYMGEVIESVFLGGVWTILYLIVFTKRIKKLWKLLNT